MPGDAGGSDGYRHTVMSLLRRLDDRVFGGPARSWQEPRSWRRSLLLGYSQPGPLRVVAGVVLVAFLLAAGLLNRSAQMIVLLLGLVAMLTAAVLQERRYNRHQWRRTEHHS